MTKTIASATDSRKRYFLTIEHGLAVHCSCPDRQHRSWKSSCKHISSFNAEVVRAATFQFLKSRFDVRENGDEATRRCYYEMSLGY